MVTSTKKTSTRKKHSFPGKNPLHMSASNFMELFTFQNPPNKDTKNSKSHLSLWANLFIPHVWISRNSCVNIHPAVPHTCTEARACLITDRSESTRSSCINVWRHLQDYAITEDRDRGRDKSGACRGVQSTICAAVPVEGHPHDCVRPLRQVFQHRLPRFKCPIRFIL